MAEARGVPRLALEPLDELLVARVPLVQHLQRDLPAELLVLGEVHLGHPARAELAHDQVAAVEQPADQRVVEIQWPWLYGLVFDGGGRIACISCFAIGAAIAPPKPLCWFSTTTAPATTGLSAGAKKMNQAS